MAHSYILGVGVKYDESKRGLRLPVKGTYSVESIFHTEHSWVHDESCTCPKGKKKKKKDPKKFA